MMKPNLTTGAKLQMYIIGKEDAKTAGNEDMKRQNVISHLNSKQQEEEKDFI